MAANRSSRKVEARILAYGCSSAAGPTTADFWRGIRERKEHSRPLAGMNGSFRACVWERSPDAPRRPLLVAELTRAWMEALSALPPPIRGRMERGDRLGVILASTKGEIDDWIWDEDAARRERDPLTPVLEEFLERAGLRPVLGVCVSNACASSLSALPLARAWLTAGSCSEVLLLAADAVGPFTLRGFHALRALTEERCRPFDRFRSGLMLGEASAAIVLSGGEARHGTPGPAESAGGGILLVGEGLHVEGFAATRPSVSGDGLIRACQAIPGLREEPPELVIAHGTGTAVNDECEELVFRALFPESGPRPAISATKGSIGHCLGASGAMDLIAACEAIRREEAFPITGTREVDPAFRGRYLTGGDPTGVRPRRVLVTSLGFGGIQAAACVARIERPA